MDLHTHTGILQCNFSISEHQQISRAISPRNNFMQSLAWRSSAGSASPAAWLQARSGRPINTILFDMDGVLADVSMSYRVAVVETAKLYGINVTQDDIVAAKSTGSMNNDWVLTHYLITNGLGNSAPPPSLDEVTTKFQLLYQGDGKGTPGLRDKETLIVSIGLIEELKRRCSKGIAVVTGRPREEALYFLELHGLTDLFATVVTMDDAPDKPDPAPVKLALERLGASPGEAMMVGDTPSDVIAAKRAGVQGFGVLTPAANASMLQHVYGSIVKKKSEENNSHDDIHDDIIHMPSMVIPLMKNGATAVLLPGLAEMLDLVPPVSGSKRRRDDAVDASSSSSPSSSSSSSSNLSSRHGEVHRATKETSIDVVFDIDGEGITDISTGVGFFDHMLDAMCKHARFNLTLKCKGDTHIDDHHSVEDCAIALGEAFDAAVGERKGIARWGYALCPLDEALSRAVVDISSRPSADVNMGFKREMIGQCSTEMLVHAIESFATSARLTVHVDVLKGFNDHHRAESAYKALAVALRMALRKDGTAGVPSTKGMLA